MILQNDALQSQQVQPKTTNPFSFLSQNQFSLSLSLLTSNLASNLHTQNTSRPVDSHAQLNQSYYKLR